MLNKELIETKIKPFCPNLTIFVYNSTDSTNTRAKEYANTFPNSNAVFVADKQTLGRGRMGRSFISEEGKGLYLSILLNGENAKAAGLATTTYMAVMASRVIERLTSLSPKIKWVNDIFVNGKKLSGILTEGRTDPDTGALAYTVCGIGINILSQEFDADVRKIATSIEDECGIKLNVNVMASEMINEFFKNIHLIGTKEIADEYRSRSFLIGKSISVIKQASTYHATVLDITDDCSLLIRNDDGQEELLFTGEVSVRED